MFDPHRRIEVTWEDEPGGVYEVTLVVHTEDRPGMLAKLTSVIADERTNIRDVQARGTEEGKGRVSITLEVRDLEQLDSLLARLRSTAGVHRVERSLGA